jgi:hypothetical protein
MDEAAAAPCPESCVLIAVNAFARRCSSVKIWRLTLSESCAIF